MTALDLYPRSHGAPPQGITDFPGSYLAASSFNFADQNDWYGATHGNFYAAATCHSKVSDDIPGDSNGMFIIAGEMICDTTLFGMHLATPKVLLIDNLTGCGFDEGWPCQEDTTLILYNDILICHCGNICTTGHRNSMHDRDLRDVQCGQLCLLISKYSGGPEEFA
jgi:hypothetical protein